MKVLTVVGNRPQFVKAAAVSRHLRELGEETLIHTGQHYDRELSEIFFEELDVPPPDAELGVGSGSHGEQTAAALVGLEAQINERGPDGVLVYGDTNSTLAGALAAAKLGVPVAHVEAGMRSFDRAMPEELNRVVADHLSSLLLCSTDTASENLQREGIADGVVVVGDVMADVAELFGPIAEQRSDVLDQLGLEPRGYFAATAHRAGNVDDPERLRALVELLGAAARIAPVVFPVHPRTRARLEAGLLAELGDANVRAVDPLGYLDFTALVRSARAVLTDSGGLQKEAYLAGVPCLTLREETEWVETVESGWNKLVDLDAALTEAALAEFEGGDRKPPDLDLYGGGNAGRRVAAELSAWLG
jgi:UDP-N-acetylglucosamine 2-epimerase (non-hydrolysing)/UDP-GlcNAc3NAcA epimerase